MEKPCCHHDHTTPSHHDHDAGHSDTSLKSAMHATLHCLTGCAIGETIGLMIGVHFALGMWPTMILATVLAFIVGITLAVRPLMKRENLSLKTALKVIWLGEVVSIGVMEIAMNGVDYMVGGVGAASLAEPIFWIGLAAAIPAGFIAALPVNYWLLKRQLKKCH